MLNLIHDLIIRLDEITSDDIFQIDVIFSMKMQCV